MGTETSGGYINGKKGFVTAYTAEVKENHKQNNSSLSKNLVIATIFIGSAYFAYKLFSNK